MYSQHMVGGAGVSAIFQQQGYGRGSTCTRRAVQRGYPEIVPCRRIREGLPFGLISLDQPLLGPLQHESQPVQIVQAGAAAQADTEALVGVLADHFPVPVGQFDA